MVSNKEEGKDKTSNPPNHCRFGRRHRGSTPHYHKVPLRQQYSPGFHHDDGDGADDDDDNNDDDGGGGDDDDCEPTLLFLP